MTKFKIETTLESMKGKLFSYNLKEHRVLRFTVTDEQVSIVTDLKDFHLSHRQAEELIKDFLPIDENKPFVPPASPRPFSGNGVQVAREMVQLPQTSISTNAAKLSEIILGNIEKVKEDASFIPQANAINDQLKSLIELGKAEVEGLKVQAMMQKMSL